MIKKLLFFCIILISIFCRGNETNPTYDYIDFNVEVGLNGIITVYAPESHNGLWDIEYGAPGFTSGTGQLVQNIYYSYKSFIVNPFEPYDFRIRLKDYWGVYGPWSQAITVNSCAVTPIEVGYNYNFDGSPIDNCWRGYTTPNDSDYASVSNSTTEFNGTSGSSILLNCSFFSNMSSQLVSPKLADLGTDKKISFWIKNYDGYGLKVGTITDPYNPSTFHLLENIPSQGTNYSQWQKITVYLTNYNGTDEYIMIRFSGTYQSTTNIYLDDFSYEQSIDCSVVSNLAVSDIEENSIQVNFDSPNHNSWEINIKNNLTQEAISTTVNATSNSIQNLMGDTPYELKVRAVCGSDFYANWSTLNFTTTCENKSVGYSTSFGEFSILDPCWNAIIQDAAITSISNFYYSNDIILYPKSGTKMIKMDNHYNESGSKAELITPFLEDLNSNKRIRFNSVISFPYGTEYGSSLIIGSMTDPNNSATFQPIQELNGSKMNTVKNGVFTWKEHIVYLNNHNDSPNSKYLAIRHGLQTQSMIFIDDFVYEEIPACTESIYLTEVDTEYNSATVAWETYVNSNASEWQIEYGINGFVQGTGTIVNVTSNPYTIQGLTFDDTVFDFYVRTKCGNDYSPWSEKGQFRTKCIGISEGNEENFESYPVGILKDQCWTSLKPIYDDFFFNNNSLFIRMVTQPYPVHSGTKSICMINNTNVPGPLVSEKTILITPRLMDFNNYKALSFWMFTDDGGYGSALEVIVGTMSDPQDYTTFTPFYTITGAEIHEGTWKQYTIDFSSYVGTDQYIGIRQGNQNGLQALYFDDFEYQSIGCPTPSHLQANQSGVNSVMLSWDDNIFSTPLSNWTLEYGVLGFTPGSGTILEVDTNPYPISGLLSDKNYQFRVRNNCQDNLTGEWSEMYSFKISCSFTAPYEDDFDQFSEVSDDPEGFCWTSTNYLSARLSPFCIDDENNCGNALLLLHLDEMISTPSTTGFFVSPYFDDFDSTKSIKFKLTSHNYETPTYNYELIVGTIENPLDFSTFEPYETVNLDQPSTFLGQEFIVNFENYIGTNKHIAFVHNGDDQYNYFVLDNVKYFTTNPCVEPTNIKFSAINNSSALIEWNQQNNVGNYEIEYGPLGFTLGNGIVINTANTFTEITNLQSNTAYQCYIKTICDVQSSNTVGPKKFTTTCEPQDLPWEENFNQMEQYGSGILPACFRTTTGDIVSYQNSLPYDIDFDDLITGVNDTHYLLSENFNTLFTPLFPLLAGTTYKLGLMARTGYEYAPVGIEASVGQGNTFAQMTTNLNLVGVPSEYQYNQLSFYYTPLSSGDYSFAFVISRFTADTFVMDNFSLTEGYNETITNNDQGFDFEDDSSQIILESTNYSFNEIIIPSGNSNNSSNSQFSSNKLLRMGGNTNNGNLWNSSNDNWLTNEESITKVNFKVDASTMTQLYLKFDLKQTYNQNPEHSAFRVIINGEIFDDIIYANNQTSFTTHYYDLNQFVGSSLNISLQHIGKSFAENGDNAYLDNIMLSETNLSIAESIETKLHIYPNPTTDILKIENDAPISKIEIINISGQSLFNSNYEDAQKVSIDLSSYPTGVYILKVKANDKIESFKIIKK